ncbi:enhancer of polycomb-like transcription factor protein [Striga asiatica]|uniref:Enhancer of polycomb-like protein n=1 Tax=Striga asiatica TaxID=4170 RepID=A0A5A7P6P3_STRAF|nr:enhancer of polycomb-like transcription factor protein [Striga asiatica]
MPSVGMRRNTRVFGAQVLRSGRRLWTKPQGSSKKVRIDHVENQWAELRKESTDIRESAVDSCKETKKESPNNGLADVEMQEIAPECGDVDVKNVDRMYGIVYKRKRKRAELGKVVLKEDRRCGKKFFRKQWRKRSKLDLSETCVVDRSSVIRVCELAVVVNGSSCRFGNLITCFLTKLLSYMSRVRIGIRRLSAFLVSKPICDAYSSGGVLFLQDSSNANNPVIRILSGSKSLIPTFSLNIFAIPTLFMHMQTRMSIRSAHLACFLIAPSVNIFEKDKKVTDMADCSETQSVTHSVDTYEKDDIFTETHSFDVPSCMEQQDSVELLPQVSSERIIRKELSQTTAAIGINKSALRPLKSRNSHHIQKRRSSLRRKKGRTHSGFRIQKSFATLATEIFRIKQENAKVKKFSELKCTVTQDMFVTGCSVNLLITEPDRCYREEGATVMLELSASKQWFLAVKEDGKKKYSLTVEKVMRASCTNRFSHATIWAVNSGLKLEFPNKHDWLIFKELYKECYERNILSPAASVIPVPGVQEVLGLAKMDFKPYVRPNSYIRMRDDELTRALAKKSPIYDMGSDDELWLAELNEEFCGGELITPESFESIIDALEKGSHCNPEENFDEQGFSDFCMHLERREVVEAIHGYWVKKRKQKRVALVKVFQLYHPRKTQVIPKSVLRKKRSFKRQASQVGRGKQRPTYPAIIPAERDTLEQQDNVHKVQEAKAAAERFEGLAILKRQKAQLLMANADLATYKAFVALRIAEAAQMAKHPENVHSFLPGPLAQS